MMRFFDVGSEASLVFAIVGSEEAMECRPILLKPTAADDKLAGKMFLPAHRRSKQAVFPGMERLCQPGKKEWPAAD
jgi:hypothetical protein